MQKNKAGQVRKYPSPWRSILIISLSTFIFEASINWIESLWKDQISPFVLGALDSIILTALVIPLLYRFVYLPMESFLMERQALITKISRLDQLHLLGQMVVSMAHEIRNPMTTVRGFLQLLSAKPDCVQYQSQYALMIDELDRVNDILTEFLSLSKDKRLNLQQISLNSIVTHLLPLISSDALLRDQEIFTELGSVPDLALDEPEISQLILNLTRNGLEAMPAGKGLTIRTYQAEQKVILEVEDQGSGIEPETLEKIGTPFFTTKKDGNGLGLAVCYSIAERHHATIAIKTGPQGSTFQVKFLTRCPR